MKTNFKLGQKVYWQEKEGEVIEIAKHHIEVNFDTFLRTFTIDGRTYPLNPPVLSHTPYTLNGFTQNQVIEKDTMVFVRVTIEDLWVIRFYSHFEDGKHYCFEHQKKSHETKHITSWYFCETENPFEK